VIGHDLLGERTPMNDLMAWNADATRMPARMHGESLRGLFLENHPARGLREVDGRPVALTDIRAPVFCLAAERDHVSPWRSVFKLHLLSDTEVTIAPTSGGVVSEPGHPGRTRRLGRQREGEPFATAEEWLEAHPARAGSWWPDWAARLTERSGDPIAPRPAATSLGAAPGEHVFG
jgi:polyhydroxyalkanoate synthase